MSGSRGKKDWKTFRNIKRKVTISEMKQILEWKVRGEKKTKKKRREEKDKRKKKIMRGIRND